jgi:hypothetical protein
LKKFLNYKIIIFRKQQLKEKIMSKTAKPSDSLGYKYWVAFEIHCTDTDKRLLKNHTIIRNKQIETEQDITSVQDTFRESVNNEYNNKHPKQHKDFKINLTCWPLYLGRSEFQEVKQKPTKPKLTLITNTNFDDLT